jgi:hypothetical protein
LLLAFVPLTADEKPNASAEDRRERTQDITSRCKDLTRH